jgi:hypothetical protein
MTKSELLAAMESIPDDFDVMIDASGLTDIAELTVDEAAGAIIIEGA